MIFSAHLKEKKELFEDHWELVFAMTHGETLEFIPGQYLMVEVGDIRRRPYTIAGSNADNTEFTLLIDTVPKGIGSKFFEALELNHAVQMQGPFGLNVLEPGAPSYLFIAAGVGIAPFIPMIRELTVSADPLIHLIQGARVASELLNTEEFLAIQSSHSNFTWTHALTKEAADNDFHGRTSDWIASHYKPLPNELVYLCGAPEMVRDCRSALIKKGALPNSLKIEVFS